MLLLSYLSNHWQRTKINTSFSSWTDLLKVCHKGQFLVHCYSTFIYLKDLFFFLDCNICNFADDTTRIICNKSLDFVLNELEQNSNIPIYWFQNNHMKIIFDKCHYYLWQAINLSKYGPKLVPI